MLTTSAAVAQPRRAVWTASSMLPSPSGECASVEQTICTRRDRVADVLAAEVEPVRQPVDLDRDALLERDLVDALEVDGVLRAAADQPAGRVAEAAHVRVAQRLLDAPGHLRSRHPLAAVDARLHPVELGEHVVGEVEPAVGEDVALDPAQDAERRQRLVGGRDLLGLAADVVGGEARHRADRRRVVADREVVVAALARGAAHLEHARAAVGPGRVAVQVAADVAELDERGRLAAERLPRAAPAGTTGGRARRRPPPRRRVRERLERRDVGGRARRAQQRGAGPRRLRGDELDRHALDRHADRAALLPLDHRHDLRQRGEALEQRRRVRGADHREPLARVAPAPRVARRLAAERAAIPPTSSRARRAGGPRGGRGSPSRASASRICASIFGPTPGTSRSRPAAAASRNSSGVRTPSARAISTERLALRARGSARARPGPGASSRSSSASSAISPVSTSSRSRASIPARSRAAPAPGRPARARPPAPRSRGSVSAARR